MTVPSTTRKAGPFTGNGSQTSFPFTFKVFAEGDVAVTLTSAVGLDSTAVLNVDYSVTINANQDTSPGGSITYPLAGDPLTAEARLTVTGDTDYDQALDIPTGGNFNAVALENQLDRATFQIQQLREILSRALLAPVSSLASGQLPRPEASAVIGWDATETALQNYPLSALATGIAYSAQYAEEFEGDGVATSFALNNDPVVLANTLVVVDGLIITPGSDYVLAASSVVFTVAPTLGAEILVKYGQAVITGGASVDSLDVSHTPLSGPVTNVRAAIRALEADDSVATEKIVDKAVTFAKIQDIATSRVLGRTTAGSGAVEELTPDAAAALISSGGNLGGIRNKLINGSFVVNQRAYVSGAATVGANQYTLDRWRVVTSGQSVTFSASGNGNQITAPAGGVEQVIEGANIEGGTYVLNWTGTATATVGGTARTKGENFTLTANTNATVRFIGGTVSNAQLEQGTAVTPFSPRPIGMELALCQRYYESGSATISGYSTPGAALQSTVPFKVTKRASPTLTSSSTTSTNVATGDARTPSVFGFNIYANPTAGPANTVFACTWTATSEL